jgi:hypothetical protein
MDNSVLKGLKAGTLVFTNSSSTVSAGIKFVQGIHKVKTEKASFKKEGNVNTQYSHVMVCIGKGKVIEATGTIAEPMINGKLETLDSGINTRPLNHALHDATLATVVTQKNNALTDPEISKIFDLAVSLYSGRKYAFVHFFLSMLVTLLLSTLLILIGWISVSLFKDAVDAFNAGMDRKELAVMAVQILVFMALLLAFSLFLVNYKKRIAGWTMLDNEKVVNKFFDKFRVGKYNLIGGKVHTYLLNIERNAICSGIAHQFIQIVDPEFSKQISGVKSIVSPAVLMREIKKSEKFNIYDLPI